VRRLVVTYNDPDESQYRRAMSTSSRAEPCVEHEWPSSAAHEHRDYRMWSLLEVLLPARGFACQAFLINPHQRQRDTDHVGPFRYLKLRGDDDQREIPRTALRPTEQHDASPAAGLPTDPQSRHRGPSTDRDDDVRPWRRQRIRVPSVDVIQRREEERLAFTKRFLELQPAILDGPRQTLDDGLDLRVVTGFVADDDPDARRLRLDQRNTPSRYKRQKNPHMCSAGRRRTRSGTSMCRPECRSSFQMM
jgi:hypothetical protein